jgi:enolase
MKVKNSLKYKKMSKIKKIHAREVLDSRGNPTVEVEMHTEKGFGSAIIPSGASTGLYEVLELRDGDKERYHGKGVLKAVSNVNDVIAPAIEGMNSEDLDEIDNRLIELDGTENKSKLGANAILGVSVASARASANENGKFLFEHLNPNANMLPLPMFNIINGGQHADSGLEIQEFMIMPVGAENFREAVRMGAEIFHTLKGILKDRGESTSVGDEGGFAPRLKDNDEALAVVVEAIEKSGFKPWNDVLISLDVAASEFYENGAYKMKVNGIDENLNSGDLVSYYDVLLRKYPIISIEDPFDQDDFIGFQKMMEEIGKTIQIVGDDLLVTNPQRLEKAIITKACNSILIKINQIGTLSETKNTIDIAKEANFTTVISHRSGETEDTTIADLAVAWDTGMIKTGSLSRTDRVAKYNQLIRIEEKLGEKAQFAGGKAFYNLKDGYAKKDQ